ncbi:His Kinase A (phospho-acceptor) domain-containing protein [Methylobacterium sp. 174MFSha1.1]|uniref:ATP-binding protein n=1 Tax=Methylobacterium sp. 174MFSha1.1 TaxID=1502749 RepID=UPI0008DFCDE7|nr:ATP-binding protein [Methylobacterium sp. 174MFSha1.1]SFV06961.1 His Kinase A (phospho-acceptor) domain-containing protein [Methylobacterium sp. 174MFSha1.1]
MRSPHDASSEHILILAPHGRDARLAQALLADADLTAVIVQDLPELVDALGETAGAVLVTEEAVRTADLAGLDRWIAGQPAWSDMPFIMLTRQGGADRNPIATRLSRILGNVSFLERPFHPTTLISVAATALRGRRRQYEARARLDELSAREAQLRELNATLESRVAEAVDERALAEEALRQSQKMEVVGQLTGGVAHDFNNLLTIIRSSVDFLRRPDLPEDRRRRYMDAVSDTVDRAAKLTGQLLAFARRQALKPETFEVGDCLHGVADMVDTVTGARIHVAVDLPDGECFIRCDRSQFETALVNMAVNARDAMDGEGTLTLRLACDAPMPAIRGHAGSRSHFAAVALSDTGTGIAADRIERIFEPFFTTKEVGKGTGLGLSQVFGFAKQSGGDIDVASVPGAGTTFTLYLPQVAAPAEPAGEPQILDASADGAGRRILVVEDNVEVGRFATQILHDLGYATEWAANAEAALDRLGSDGDGFDAVFSDVVMPGMGGVALAETLRSRLPHLPVVLTSGYSHVLAEEGSHGFELLHKPYSAEQLSHVLRRIGSGSGKRASATRDRRTQARRS